MITKWDVCLQCSLIQDVTWNIKSAILEEKKCRKNGTVETSETNFLERTARYHATGDPRYNRLIDIPEMGKSFLGKL